MSANNLGHVTAYGYAKSKGYTGTEEEYAQFMADFTTAAETAVDAASDAQGYKNDAATSATNAGTYASSAEGYKNTANAAAQAAETAAQDVLLYKGSPLTASTVAGMTDTTHTYVYTGSETGYVAGNWYYYDGGSWVSGGAYNASAVQTDDTLSTEDMAADAKAAGGVIADVFSASTAYKEGAYVLYSGKMYQFTKAHAAGVWNTSDVREIKTGIELTKLFNAVKKECNVSSTNYTLYVSNSKYYYFNYTKFVESTSKKYLSTRYVNDLRSVIAFELRNNDYKFNVCYFDETGSASTSESTGYLGNTGYTTGIMMLPKEAKMFLITFTKADETAITDEDQDTIKSSLFAYFSTDDSLTVENVAADAKAVGEVRDSSDRNLISMYEEVIDSEWSDGGINSSGGNTSDYNGVRIRSDYYYLKNGMQITIPSGMTGRVGLYTSEGGAAGFIKWLDNGFWTGTKIFNNPPGDVIRMQVQYDPQGEILPSAGAAITIKRYSFIEQILAIPQDSDLNDYTTPGSFYSPNTSITQTLLNCPLKDTSFRMDVTEARYNGSGRIRQTIFKADYNEQDGFFMRYVSNNNFGPWDHYLPSKAQHTPQIIYPNVKAYDERTIDNVVARFRVGTYNVAHYRMNQYVYDYISEHNDAIEKWRRWIANSNMDFLFITEDSQYIDSAQTKLATKYLYNPYFYENDRITHSHRILTKTDFDTTILESVTVPNVNPSGQIGAYYIDWCISTVENIGSILMAVIHNFPSGPSSIGTEEQVKENRVNYYAAIKNLLTEQSGNYDYVIIAGDTNAGNYVNETTENTEYDMGLLESLCEDTDTHLVNGDEIGWFKTVPSSTANRAYDNIIVSNNIRVEKIECNPYMYEELWSDHVPVIAEVSLLG